jgi:hypothetical protein
VPAIPHSELREVRTTGTSEVFPAVPAGTGAAPGRVGDEAEAPGLLVELDGKSVPMASCDWVEWAPCGCPVGTATGRPDVTTEGDAWKVCYPRQADGESAQKQGYRWELMTHERWSAEVADRMIAGCPHVGPFAETGPGSATNRNEPATTAVEDPSVAPMPSPPAGLHSDTGAAPSRGQAARSIARKHPGQSPQGTRGRGPR